VVYASNLVMDMSSQTFNDHKTIFNAAWRTWQVNDQ
jgi:hypothetical protein